MIPRNGLCLLLGLALVPIAACASLNGLNFRQQPAEPIASTSPENSPEQEPDKGRPDTKIITMNLEGTSTEVELTLFNQESIPFTTYYPTKDFVPEVLTTQTGTEVRLYFSPAGKKDTDAYVSFFLPNRDVSIEALQDWILGEQGMMVRNRWELVDRTDIVSYPWAEDKLIYQEAMDFDTASATDSNTNPELVVGSVYIGQENGYTFYTLTHYPVEYGDGFEPRSNIVLENLQFTEP